MRTSAGEIRKACVVFTQEHLTGIDLIERAGFRATDDTSAIGTAICKFNGVGCGSDNCFCRYPTFWGYWAKEPKQSSWTFSSVGASQRVISDGAMDGWSWGRNGKPAPPNLALSDVCTPDAIRAAPTGSARAITPLGTARATRPNYLPFVGFLALLLVLALGASLLRRRRAARQAPMNNS